ncbi:MAG: substrate-binding domain-containing protein [Acutalibacteraceae bacterium]
MKCKQPAVALIAFIFIVLVLFSACNNENNIDNQNNTNISDSVLGKGNSVIRILSGSENKELEDILQQFAEKEKICIEMTYQGSIDIMHTLEQDNIPYDAVWPASSLWLTTGDTAHRVKHTESISISPVVFGIRKSLAESLGFVGREVSVNDILEAIKNDKLKFCMTSATQSNSGASAYIGFLYAMLGNPEMITSEDLKNKELKEQMTELFSGVDRSSGSSEWLANMFLEGGYDAMVNYECLIIKTNEELTKQGKEPLYVVYPYDGLSISDSPLGYIDNNDKSKEDTFLRLQEYLLSSETQNLIQRTGRRSGYTGVSEQNKDVFNSDWGLQCDRVLSPVRMPSSDVLFECLELYQTEFKKPSLNIYCLDYSSSMNGDGNTELVNAMEQLLVQENAKKNFIQASEDEVNIFIPFNDNVISTYSASGSGDELENLYKTIKNMKPGGGTNMYKAAEEGLKQLENYDLSEYMPAIIILTDGYSRGDYDEFEKIYLSFGEDIPIFSITFGNSDSTQLEQLAQLTNARVFDGKNNLTDAFREVKGYS